jgi:hypothetical protein
MEDEDVEVRIEVGESEALKHIYEEIYRTVYIREEGLPEESLRRFVDGANGIQVRITYIIAFNQKDGKPIGGVRVRDFGGHFIKGEKGAVLKQFRGLKIMSILGKECLAHAQRVGKPIFFWVFSKEAGESYRRHSEIVVSPDPVFIYHENGKKQQLYFAYHPVAPKPKL